MSATTKHNVWMRTYRVDRGSGRFRWTGWRLQAERSSRDAAEFTIASILKSMGKAAGRRVELLALPAAETPWCVPSGGEG